MAAADVLPSTAELDAELSRLLLDDDDDARPSSPPSRPSPPLPTERERQLEERVLALERVLADRLDAFQELAELRIERAAMDAAMAVRRAFATTETPDAEPATHDADSVITQDI